MLGDGQQLQVRVAHLFDVFDQLMGKLAVAKPLRGIVAGPQSVAIAQLHNNIRDANVPVVAELKVHTDLLRGLPSAIASVIGGGVGLPGQTFDTNAGPTMG